MCGAIKNFFCELLFSCTLITTPAPPVDELIYGTVLFDYFQEQQEAALLNALVAESRGQRGKNTARFDLAAGSFAFKLGMYRFANRTFNAVAEQQLTGLDRRRLAFHLAREYHRRSDWSSLVAQLDKLSPASAGVAGEHPEVLFMNAELATQQGRFDQAAGLLSRMPMNSDLRAYGLFNLGVAHRAAGQLPQSRATFTQLVDMRPASEEVYDLTQRARLALAYIARSQQDSVAAQEVLQALPAAGRYQEVAMAAFGRLAMDTEDYELAARIWMTLQQQDYWSPSRTTARFGYPLSLQNLADDGRATMSAALAQYQQAQRSFETRLAELSELSGHAADRAWVRELLTVFSRDQADSEQVRDVMLNWQEKFAHTDWIGWLAKDDVNQALEQWRELGYMETWLDALPEHLLALQEVAQERHARSVAAQRMLVGDGQLLRRDQMAARADVLAAQLTWLDAAQPEPTDEWMYLLSGPQEQVLLQDLSGMREVLVHMSAHDQRKWAARIARLQGVLFYRLVDERAKRIQRLRKTHKSIVTAVDDLDQRIARVQQAEANFVAGVGGDFSGFRVRAEGIAQAVAEARNARETMLARQIRQRLRNESGRVQQYLLATRIAIARATDQLASREGARAAEADQW